MARSKEEGTSGSVGPSYWDVERLKDDLCRRFNCWVHFDVTISFDKRHQRHTWTVTAVRSDAGTYERGVGFHSSYSFRGLSGATTMPAAMCMALNRLWERLEDRESSAASQASF